ncbi:GIY-YIG catalytic domain-containing endonuclease [Acanthocystis turfacea Chlorella virus NTS-1]|nr:GIY-YIG catalytic domain-containing endonuclease [Acanthocystis turfacea Chlorella virus NTS-1]
MSLISEESFVMDNVMFWEAFRWERLDAGHIYIHKFPGGKMYAGQTINLNRRFGEYRNLRGSNPHHTRALKHYGVDTMKVSFALCPKYLLDAVETFVIRFFNLTDVTKGYNKTTGGNKGYRHSKETRMKMSVAKSGERHHFFGKTLSEETRTKLSIANSGENNYWFGKSHAVETRAKISAAISGENNPNFGKTFSEETRSKISKSMTGKKRTEETSVKMSVAKQGENNPKSKPICAFGKLYDTASNASNTLREVCDTKDKGNFMSRWVGNKKHKHNVFYVTKEFYATMKVLKECITLEMYDDFLKSH